MKRLLALTLALLIILSLCACNKTNENISEIPESFAPISVESKPEDSAIQSESNNTVPVTENEQQEWLGVNWNNAIKVSNQS